jgi:hypothetical protein
LGNGLCSLLSEVRASREVIGEDAPLSTSKVVTTVSINDVQTASEVRTLSDDWQTAGIRLARMHAAAAANDVVLPALYIYVSLTRCSHY